MTRKAPEMNKAKWVELARSTQVRDRIKDDKALSEQENFQTIIQVAERRQTLDWEEAVALVHMVYGWMPHMLTIEPHSTEERSSLVANLQKVKAGGLLTFSELEDVKRFANKSIVGASKLLHVLHPSNYIIWDSRVANLFLWDKVSRGTFNTSYRYLEYLRELREWSKEKDVIDECASLRKLNSHLGLASDLRLLELVLYLNGEPK